MPVTPTSTPVTPTVIPTIPGEDIEIFRFDTGAEGWTFQNPSPFGAVAGNHQTDRQALAMRAIADGGFAYWESPMLSPPIVGEAHAIKTAPGRTLFRAVWRIASDAPAAHAVPGFRLRQSSPNFEQTDALQISTSLPPSDPRPVLAPGTVGREYASYFLHPPGTTSVRLDFDLMHFGEDDAGNSALYLEQTNLQTLTEREMGELGEANRTTFTGSNANGWTPRTSDGIIPGPAEFGVSPEGLLIRGRSRIAAGRYEGPDAGTAIFGFWAREMTEATLRGGRVYRIDWEVGSDAPEASRSNLPAFRLRLNASSHQLAAIKQVESRGDQGLVPAAGQPVLYTMFVEIPPQIDGDTMILSFDYLYAPTSDDDPTIGLYLREVAVREIGAR